MYISYYWVTYSEDTVEMHYISRVPKQPGDFLKINTVKFHDFNLPKQKKNNHFSFMMVHLNVPFYFYIYWQTIFKE